MALKFDTGEPKGKSLRPGSSRHVRRRAPMSLLVAAAMCLCISTAHAITLFNSVEQAHQGLEPFPQWSSVLERHYKDLASGSTGPLAKWFSFISKIKGQPPGRQLYLVNQYINKHRYVVDKINWGLTDYWATPREFLRKNGDCEDFAIAKFMTLRALGWKAQGMRIVAVKDQNLNVMHAILCVDNNGELMILDNQASNVLHANRIRHYEPVYSVNEQGWWRHKSKASAGKSKVRIIKKGKKQK